MGRPFRVTKKTCQFIAIALSNAFALANQAKANFTLEAAPNALPPRAELTLSRHDVDQRSTSRILTTSTEADGSLTLEVAEDAGIFVVKINGEYELTLAAAADETIELSLDGGSLKTSGSPGTRILQDYETLRKKSLARLVYPIRSDIKEAKLRQAPTQKIVELTQAEVDAYQRHTRELNDFVLENAGDTMALYGCSLRLNGDYRGDEIEEQVEAFSKKHGDIAATRSLAARIQIYKQVALGSFAPDLLAQNLSGEIEKLSDYRGRYLLVDFWASWCPPCRLENQHYAKLRGQTQSDRFNIFAVNLDTNPKAWERAVARDKADWIHVSDLQGWTSPLAATYGVNALPSSFLLDPEGRILAKDLRGPALDAKLKELGLY